MPGNPVKKKMKALLDDEVPIQHRIQLLLSMGLEDEHEGQQAIAKILQAATSADGELVYRSKIEELDTRLEELEQGPLRVATFVGMLEAGERFGNRASVVLEDGSSAFVNVPRQELANDLCRGDTVLVDVQGKAVVHRVPGVPDTGELARLERRLDGDCIEVTLRERERQVFRTAEALTRQLDAGEAAPGRMLIVCPRRRMAFSALPARDGLGHYRHLSREGVPGLTLADLGSPPGYIEELIELVRLEMVEPALRRRYGLQRSVMRLLSGPTGTGKTYSIYALWHELYRTMSEVTGVPVEELPPRVMRLRMPQVLSQWLGESDKNLDRFFCEVEQLAAEPFVSADGRSHRLPVLCVLEEIDGLARARGREQVYDRILTTALQRLDTSRPELRDKLILFVATTNVPEQVDPAFLRRVGGTVEHFGRLGRREFAAVLDKQLAERPVAVTDGEGADRARAGLIAALTTWMYPPDHADTPQVELCYAGSDRWDAKYRRHFVTASLVDRAVQGACRTAALAEYAGEADPPGLSVELLIEALDRQVRGVVDSVKASNAHDHVDIEEGTRVAAVRRPRVSSIQPVQLETIA